MNHKKLFIIIWLIAVAAVPLSVSGNNLDIAVARDAAISFLNKSANPTLKSAAGNHLKLVNAEPSKGAGDATAYYAFNITGGGFVIVAGDDRAPSILGYSDSGLLDFDRLPSNVSALLSGYVEEISYLQSHPELTATPTPRLTSITGVAPLIKSHWGQEMPYYLQCPIYNGEYCVVGCVATAMSQVMHYWRYPTSSPEVASYYCYDIGQTLPDLDMTNFDYAKMLNSYCHWDWETSQLIQDSYTNEQAQAVAKLARYCGQAVRMGYSPEGSGAYVSSQLSAMKNFGYSQNADDVSRDGWYGNYTDAQWESMIRNELDAGRPILYSANDYAAGGHAFVCDGYNNEGYFHFNFGWYGTCDGWFVTTALNMTHRDGDDLHFNWNHEMLTGVEPPTYVLLSMDDITLPDNLMVLGETVDVNASNVTLRTTFPYVNLQFNLCNASGTIKAKSQAINVTLDNLEQGCDLTTTITLPKTLAEGCYDLKSYYYINDTRMPVFTNNQGGQLNVVGHLAKYNAPFTIDDVTACIQYLLNGSHEVLKIDDVTELINYLLSM